MNWLDLVGKDVRHIIISIVDVQTLGQLSQCSKVLHRECKATLNGMAREHLSGVFCEDEDSYEAKRVLLLLFRSATTGRLLLFRGMREGCSQAGRSIVARFHGTFDLRTGLVMFDQSCTTSSRWYAGWDAGDRVVSRTRRAYPVNFSCKIERPTRQHVRLGECVDLDAKAALFVLDSPELGYSDAEYFVPLGPKESVRTNVEHAICEFDLDARVWFMADAGLREE